MHIHIVGGGIIGLCSAWYLSQAGCEVSILDESDLSDGTSHGNAGMIVPSHFVPLAAPGVIAQGIKWMFKEKSPFYIKPRLNWDLMRWLWKFYRSCDAKKVAKAAPVLLEFNSWSKSLYEEFSRLEGFDFSYEKKGLLMLYKTLKVEKEEKELAEKAHEMGVDVKVLSSNELAELEPDIKVNARGGIYFPGDSHLYPSQFIAQLVQALKEAGVHFLTGKKVSSFAYTRKGVEAIFCENGEKIAVDHLLLSAGSWTPHLLKKVGIDMLLQDGKGYSFTLGKPSLRPRIPTILTEAKVAVTPMGEDLRVGGSLELSNLDKKVNPKRFAGIYESLSMYYPEIQAEKPTIDKIWQGYRPCTPDGMPFLDRSKKLPNLTVATGHGMMGMSLGPATGKLASEIILDNKRSLDTSLFRLDRF